jgi:hypothetical protein
VSVKIAIISPESEHPKWAIERAAMLHFDVRAGLAIEAFASDSDEIDLVRGNSFSEAIWM